jgi:hypothetical protein
MPDSAAVVSLATPSFATSLARLERSLDRVGFRGARRLWRPGSWPAGAPTHEEVPFAFKPFCLAEAQEAGYRQVLWLDATCIAVRPLGAILDALEACGCALFRNGGRRLGEWASDEALAALGLDRELALRLPELNACVVGLDLDHPLGSAFLERWLAAARDGTAFRGTRRRLRSADEYQAVKWNLASRSSCDGRVRGHRHDQTVAGAIAHQLGLDLLDSGVQPWRRVRRPIRPDTIVVNGRRPARLDGLRLALWRGGGRVAALRAGGA